MGIELDGPNDQGNHGPGQADPVAAVPLAEVPVAEVPVAEGPAEEQVAPIRPQRRASQGVSYLDQMADERPARRYNRRARQRQTRNSQQRFEPY